MGVRYLDWFSRGNNNVLKPGSDYSSKAMQCDRMAGYPMQHGAFIDDRTGWTGKVVESLDLGHDRDKHVTPHSGEP